MPAYIRGMMDAKPRLRLFVAAPLVTAQPVGLTADQTHYLFSVMRLQPGERLLLFNAAAGEWLAECTEAGKRGGVVVALAQIRPPQLPPDLWLVFAPLKKSRTDFVVEKATEMGVRRILPVFTRNTNAERVNVERLQAHAIEAAEQCELVFVPQVMEPQPLERLLAHWPAERALVFCDERRDAQAALPPAPAAILIGPEGGFTDAESAQLRRHPAACTVRLGPRVLRADTAAVAALALWQQAAGDWR